MVEYHKENPLPLQVLQAGLKGNQSELFRQALDRSSSLFVLQEASSPYVEASSLLTSRELSLLHKEQER